MRRAVFAWLIREKRYVAFMAKIKCIYKLLIIDIHLHLLCELRRGCKVNLTQAFVRVVGVVSTRRK